MLSRSLRASSTKSSQPPSQDDTEWWVRRKNSTDRRKNDDARFQSPIKTLPQVAEHIVQQNQPKYLFQDELELIKNESPLSNKTKSSAVVVKRDMPGVKLQGHSMKSLAMDILFCEQCASFSRISGTAGSSNLP
uniref:Uncharacterized protein n=1 Tax=Plectus sambesii TaxID=2011161 RepID=A0A914VHM3_9BILA